MSHFAGQMSNWKVFPESQLIVVERFVVVIVLHEQLNEQMQHGLRLMKYAINHPWKFKNWFTAFLSGFMQSFVIFGVETVNLVVLLTNTDPIEIVFNFASLVIIAEFGDHYYKHAMVNPNLKQLLEDEKY